MNTSLLHWAKSCLSSSGTEMIDATFFSTGNHLVTIWCQIIGKEIGILNNVDNLKYLENEIINYFDSMNFNVKFDDLSQDINRRIDRLLIIMVFVSLCSQNKDFYLQKISNMDINNQKNIKKALNGIHSMIEKSKQPKNEHDALSRHLCVLNAEISLLDNESRENENIISQLDNNREKWSELEHKIEELKQYCLSCENEITSIKQKNPDNNEQSIYDGLQNDMNELQQLMNETQKNKDQIDTMGIKIKDMKDRIRSSIELEDKYFTNVEIICKQNEDEDLTSMIVKADGLRATLEGYKMSTEHEKEAKKKKIETKNQELVTILKKKMEDKEMALREKNNITRMEHDFKNIQLRTIENKEDYERKIKTEILSINAIGEETANIVALTSLLETQNDNVSPISVMRKRYLYHS